MTTSGFHNRRNKRNTKKKRIEEKKVLIALEDTKSSRFYFKKLVQDKNLAGDVIFAKHIGTDPNNVVAAIVSHLKSKSHHKYEKKWVVIDKDDYSKNQINGAIQRARGLGICVAISNEAYELWILLHFQAVTAHTNRVEINRKLNQIFTDEFKTSYNKSSHDVYSLIIGRQDQAIHNSRLLVESYIRDNGAIDPFLDNPLTTIYQLVECLNTLYDISDESDDCFPL